MVVSPFAGRAVDRFGERPVAVLSLLAQAIGYLWLAAIISPATGYRAVILALVISGAGISMAGPALQKAVLGAATPAQTGIASGVFNTFRQLGAAVGTSLAVVLFSTFGAMASTASFVTGFQAALVGSTLLTLPT